MSDDGDIVLDVWITIEKLVSPAPDEDSGQQKDDHRDGECDAQRRNAGLFNYRYHRGNIRFHGKSVPVYSIGFYDAFVGFSDAAEARIMTTSSEVTGIFLRSIEIERSVEIAEKFFLFLPHAMGAELARLDEFVC